MNEREILQNMAKNNEESLRFISKDMVNLARMLKKTSLIDNEEQAKANLVQASFYLHAYTLATKAFNKMVKEKEEDQSNSRTLADYFMDETTDMQARALKAEEQNKKENEDGV